MTYYVRVKKETEAWNAINKRWTYQQKWIDNMDKIKKFIGTDPLNKLSMDNRVLTIKREALPEHLKSSFAQGSPAKAKKNSKLNKDWIKFCESLGLEMFDFTFDFSMKFNVYGLFCETFRAMFGDYYLKVSPNSDWAEVPDWCEVVSESEFLSIRSKWLKQYENEEKK